ncbi:MAG: hypothetical protein ACLTDM_04430 [Clostridium butyricum]
MKINNFVDERKTLNNFLEDKTSLNNDTYRKIMVYIKYLKEQGYNKPQIRNELDKLMEEYYVGFVLADWEDRLNKMVNKYTKPEYKQFKVVEDINITYDELNFIKNRDDIEIEKLLFIMLVLAKSSNSSDLWVNCDSKDLFKLSNYKYDSHQSLFEQREFLLHDLAQEGLIAFKKDCTSTSFKLLYGETTIGEGLILKIDETNIERIVMEYMNWRGNPQGYCTVCGKRIVSRANNKPLYCSKCKKEKQRSWEKQSKEKAKNDFGK